MSFKVGDIVFYTGEYDNCHGHKYKITKTYDRTWYDLEIITPTPLWGGVYQELNSVMGG